MIGATVAIVQDKRVQKNNGSYAIKLRITVDRKQYYFPINQWMTVVYWQKTHGKRPSGMYMSKREEYNEIEKKAKDVLKELNVFSMEVLKRKFNNQSVDQRDVLQYLQENIKIWNYS